MWIGDYKRGNELQLDDENFDALLAAAILKGDWNKVARLRMGFPDEVAEVQRRHDAPGGALTLEEWIAEYCEDDHPKPPAIVREYFSRDG